MTLFPYISSFSIVVPAITAGITFKRSKIKLFHFYIFVATLIELILFFTALFGWQNWWLAYSFLLLELVIVPLVFHQILLRKNLKKLFLIILSVMFSVAIILLVTGNHILMHHIQNFFLLSLTCATLFDLYVRNDDLPLLSSKEFWIVFGLLFFFLFSSLSNLLIEPLLAENSDPSLEWYFNTLVGIVNMVTYTIFTIGLTKKQ